MSWSVSAKAARETAKEEITKQFDNQATIYAGKVEGDDIAAAKERVLKLLDAIVLGDNGYGIVNDGVQISAYGSHSVTNNGLISGSFSVSVSAVKLEG